MLFYYYSFMLTACGSESSKDGLGMDKYADSVIAGTPTSLTSSKEIDATTVRVSMNKIFNNESEPGNLVGESKKLDKLIGELNNHVTVDNEADGGGFKVIANPDGTLTLPFFGDTVAIDYLVKMIDDSTGSKYAGYKMDDTSQTVVLFHTGPANTARDVVLFYGKKTGTTVDIYQALIGVDASDNKTKAWAFKIHIEGDTFTITHNSDAYTHSGTGNSKGNFILREWETGTAAGTLGFAVLYNYGSGAFTEDDTFSLSTPGAAMGDTDLTRPSTITAEYWTAMITFVNAIGNPDTVGICPESLTGFTNDFIKSKF